MVDPVIATDGHTYERKAIKDWMKKSKNMSPMTREKIDPNLIPNFLARKQICEYLQNKTKSAKEIGKTHSDFLETSFQNLPTMDLQSKMSEVSSGKAGTYEGKMNPQGQRHGWGKMYFTNNDFYQGEFMNGTIQGLGRRTYGDGHIYDGEWVKGKPIGKAVMMRPDGSIEQGNFKDGIMNGEGIVISKDSRIFQGTWVNGVPHGRGKMLTPDKTYIEGKWEKGNITGKAISLNPDGSSYEGKWKDSRKNGKGVLVERINDQMYVSQTEWNKGVRII